MRSFLALLVLAGVGWSGDPAGAATRVQRARALKNVKVLDAWEAQMRARLRQLERKGAAGPAGR